jgi:hypothetical protein
MASPIFDSCASGQDIDWPPLCVASRFAIDPIELVLRGGGGPHILQRRSVPGPMWMLD